MDNLDVKEQWVLVEDDLNESREENRVTSESEHPSLILLVVGLCAEGNYSVAPANHLADLEYHNDAEQQVSILEEVSVLLENFNGNVEIDSDIL